MSLEGHAPVKHGELVGVLRQKVDQAVTEWWADRDEGSAPPWGGDWIDLPFDIAIGAVADLMGYVEDNLPEGLDLTLRQLGVGLSIMKADGEWL